MPDKSDVDVIDRPPVKVGKPVVDNKPKLQPPSKWHVVLHNTTGKAANCVPCVLMMVFNKSSMEARRHAAEARQSGRSSIQQTTKDVAETRASNANEKLSHGVCYPASGGVRFKAERCP